MLRGRLSCRGPVEISSYPDGSGEHTLRYNITQAGRQLLAVVSVYRREGKQAISISYVDMTPDHAIDDLL